MKNLCDLSEIKNQNSKVIKIQSMVLQSQKNNTVDIIAYLT